MRINYLMLFVVFNIFVSCKNSSVDTPHNYRITYYQRIEEGYHYSSDVFPYHSNVYRPILSSEYVSDTLVSVQMFKTEGKINYNIEDIEADKLLFQVLHIPKKRSIKISKSQLIDNGRIYEVSELVKDSIYSLQKDSLFLYTIN